MVRLMWQSRRFIASAFSEGRVYSISAHFSPWKPLLGLKLPMCYLVATSLPTDAYTRSATTSHRTHAHLREPGIRFMRVQQSQGVLPAQHGLAHPRSQSLSRPSPSEGREGVWALEVSPRLLEALLFSRHVVERCVHAHASSC